MANGSMSNIILGKAEDALSSVKDESVSLVWTDPPFNTGKIQKHLKGASYLDRHSDYLSMMRTVVKALHAKLKPDGVCCICLDYRESHRVKILCDEVFGEDNFLGEIIWHSELGGIAKRSWTMKHNTILMFAKTKSFKFYFDRIPTETRKSPKGKYVAPKIVTSVWTHTMSNSDAQRVSYPNQKPVEIIRPFIEVHTDVGDIVLDPFGGSGSTGAAAKELGRQFILIDENPEAIKVMERRLLSVESI